MAELIYTFYNHLLKLLPRPSRSAIQIGLAVLSFVIFVGVFWVLPQERDPWFSVERQGLASAVSNIVYGAPFGAYYSGVLAHFCTPGNCLSPVRPFFEQLPLKAQLGDLVTATADGNGIGFNVAATLALRLFGLHASSLSIFTLVLMAVSGTALLWRFRGAFAWVVVLHFCALTIMLFSCLVWESYSQFVTLGGIRYFSLVAILPAYHLMLELSENSASRSSVPTPILGKFLLIIQTTILLFAVIVRNNAAALLLPIGLIGLAMIWRVRRNSPQLRQTLGKSAVITLAAIGLVGALVWSAPSYVKDGRVSSVFWHRTFVGFAFNPNWPFGDIGERYDDCRRLLGYGMREAKNDAIGACVWIHYALEHGMSSDEINGELYDGRYEAVLRSAVIDISRRYPAEALKTFFYYKPKLILSNLVALLRINMDVFPLLAIGLLVAALVNLFVCLVQVAGMPTANRWRVWGATLLFAASTIPPYLIAWAVPYTMADLLFYCIFAGGLVLEAVLTAVRHVQRAACASLTS